MIRLVVGADRSGMRCALIADGIQTIDVTHAVEARERRERVVIARFLQNAGYAWESVDRYILLQLPHSHTSVRVVATILKTSAWYHGKSYAALAVDRLDELDSVALEQRLSVALSSPTYS